MIIPFKHSRPARFHAALLFYTVLSLALLPTIVYAQSFSKKENYQWEACGFNGIGYGMSFNTDPPQEFYAAQIGVMSMNGSASVSDKNGSLLFYTDGNIIWDRNHNVMLNGWDIKNDGSGTSPNYIYDGAFGISSGYNFDGVAIIPMPGSSSKYYIFSISDSVQLWGQWFANTLATEKKLYCSIVDMELNNGLGAVDTPHKAIVIADSMAGNLHAVTGEDCNYWLVGYGSDGAYRSFNITFAGIDTQPVISTVTLPLSPFTYEMNISPDRSKLVQAFGDEALLCDFDPATGIVSNAALVGTQDCVGGSFSPNSSKLYLNGIIGLRQYDLSVTSMPMTLLTINNMTAFEQDHNTRLGPDGIIYGTYRVSDIAGVRGFRILNPDLAGTACLFDTFSNAPLIIGSYFSYQLPNEVAVLTYDSVASSADSPLCFGAPTTLHIANSTATDFHWYKHTIGANYYSIGSDTSSIIADEPGTYTVSYFTANPCLYHQDTFVVRDVFFNFKLHDTAFCFGEPAVIEPQGDAAQLLWPDGSTGSSYTASASGLCHVQATRDGCTITDSAYITIKDMQEPFHWRDTTLCLEGITPFSLSVSLPPTATALWSTGDTAEQIYTRDSGIVWVQITDNACRQSDTVWIQKEYCECPSLIPTAFSPNGDGLNDTYSPALTAGCRISMLKMQIYNRWGQMIFVTYDPAKGWDGTYNGKPADVGVYYYTIQMELGRDRIRYNKKGDFVLLR